LLRYFASLFLPLHLNVDTDLAPFNSLTPTALAGFLFVALLLIAAWLTARRPLLRPISFGILWFLIASLPTSLYRLSEVENDHRMFLPFVGLVLSVVWTLWLGVDRLIVGVHRAPVQRALLAVVILLLIAYGYGTHLRNIVWHSDETLWRDDVQKCPRNGRGWMNYGLTQMAKAAYIPSLDSFTRALAFTPNYFALEINLGIAHGALHHDAEAEKHFQRAIALAPTEDQTHYYYGRWLYQSGRVAEALNQLKIAVQLNPPRIGSREFLAAAYRLAGEDDQARNTAAETLRLDPDNAAAKALLSQPVTRNANDWINASLYQYQSGNYALALAYAGNALALDPNSAIAHNNRGAAYAGLQQWSLAVAEERRALQIDPGFRLASNNLALYENRSSEAASGKMTAEEWINLSLEDNQAGQYEKSIQDARAALQLRPGYAEAYNNIAAGYASLKKWDEAIAAAEAALRYKPDYPLARNNLTWALEQKKRGEHGSVKRN
jgi:tetratricopeptide (TPR) repeat protein